METIFGYRQTQTFPGGLIESAAINALVSLSLNPATADTEFPQIRYHKDQANGKDYYHCFTFKKWQADKVGSIFKKALITKTMQQAEKLKKGMQDDKLSTKQV